jgi:hypothetical protein
MRLFICGIVLLAAAFSQGCKCGEPAGGPQQQVSPAGQQAAMKAAQTALMNMGFQIEKYDSDAGFIRTKPLGGAQFFEFWRGDNADCYDVAEASLHSLMRTVEMTFKPMDGQLSIVCEARVSRLSIPERNVTGTAGAYAMFTKSSSQLMTTRLSPEQQEQMAWIDMGLDADLARKVLSAMDRQLAAGRGRTR